MIPRCFQKALLPKKLIQFYDTQSRDLAKPSGESRLARSSGANDDYALHTDEFSLEHGSHSVPRGCLRDISSWLSHSRKGF